MLTVTATDSERAQGSFEQGRAQAAADALWRDGAVVLAGAVEIDHVRVLRARMEADLPELLRRGRTNGPEGHYSQGPPVTAPYVFADVVANRLAVQVASLVVRGPVQLTLFTANTILPCSEPQRLHRDHGNLWKDLEQSHPPAFVSVHVPLVDMDDRNGATELWPGTHRLAHEGPVPEHDAQLAARAALVPPVQVTCPEGGIILRDGRAWHRGMPNFTDQPRIMISMIYATFWSRQGVTPFHRSAQEALREAPLELNPTWVGDEHDHLMDFRDPARPGAR